MVVYVIIKKNRKPQNFAALVYAHGGGAMMGTPDYDNGLCSRLACENDIVIFNVDYRLAPEHRTPAGGLDMIAALKYAHEKAHQYGIDTYKISLGGSSGGAFTSMIASILLVRQKENGN